jgi:peroxiredoxin family protein
MSDKPSGDTLGILLLSGDYARAHYAFVLASSAAALGRSVVFFATNSGCRALLADWSDLAGAERDAIVTTRGVAGLVALREAAQDLGVALMVCEAGLHAEGIDPSGLLPNVERTGATGFLAATRGGQIITL